MLLNKSLLIHDLVRHQLHELVDSGVFLLAFTLAKPSSSVLCHQIWRERSLSIRGGFQHLSCYSGARRIRRLRWVIPLVDLWECCRILRSLITNRVHLPVIWRRNCRQTVRSVRDCAARTITLLPRLNRSLLQL